MRNGRYRTFRRGLVALGIVSVVLFRQMHLEAVAG